MTASAAQARVLTAVALTGLGLFLVMRQQQRQPASASTPGAAAATAVAAPQAGPSGPTPQEAIYAMFDAARAGDVEGYTRWFAGATAESLSQSVAEQGRERFARYLAETHAPVKGLAVEAAAASDERRAKMRVEYVYADRNEAQLLELERAAPGGEWRIVRVERMERVKTSVPYGSPAQQ